MNVVIRGHSRHVATVSNDELQAVLDHTDRKLCPVLYAALTKELSNRPQAKEPVYKPVLTSKEKDAAGVERDVAVGGYQSFSGGSRQTTERQKGKGIPCEWT
jgi:hypothetical protein